MKAKLVREYIELPGKTREQILSDMKYASKEQLNNALINACDNNDLEKIKMLIDAGIDINFQDEIGNTALIHAASFAKKETVEFLLNNGADINIGTDYGWTPLMKAVLWRNKDDDVIKLLKKYENK
jgi:ankyrin repeat protein